MGIRTHLQNQMDERNSNVHIRILLADNETRIFTTHLPVIPLWMDLHGKFGANIGKAKVVYVTED